MLQSSRRMAAVRPYNFQLCEDNMEPKSFAEILKYAAAESYAKGWEAGWNAAWSALKTADDRLREKNNGHAPDLDTAAITSNAEQAAWQHEMAGATGVLAALYDICNAKCGKGK